MITYGEAKKLIARFAGAGGRCTTAPDVDDFVRQVLEYLLISGEYGNLRKFEFQAQRGMFTVPYELEVPLKIKINGCIGTAWDRWFEWHSGNDMLGGEKDGCFLAGRALFEDPNLYPTVYEIPVGGARIGALGTCCEEETAHLIVQGENLSGQPVYTYHKGELISGEYLSIVKGEIRYTDTVFSKVTGVLKTITKGYTQLLWINNGTNTQGFLSDYSPLDTKPSYRRYRITAPGCNPSVRVTVLGRIRLKPAYMDTDYIPFDTRYTLSLAAQTINANFNNDVATAQAKEAAMTNAIQKANEYKRVENGQPIEVFHPLSSGLIQNIITPWGYGGRWGGGWGW